MPIATRVTTVVNFGANLSWRPALRFIPADESEVLAILDAHRGRNIRAIGHLHSWSQAPVGEDVLLDLCALDRVQVERREDGLWVTAEAGCQIKRLLVELERQAGATLPSMGLISEQTIAGAISTGTHGSGKHSLSHYMEEIRLATYDPQTGRAVVKTIRGGDELRAARCSLGCLGVILSVGFHARDQYMVEEHFRQYAEPDDVLAAEATYPLQQFFLMPWSWQFLVQHRREVTAPRSRLAWLYRMYWFTTIDLGLNLAILLLVRVLGSRRLLRFCLRQVFPRFVVRGWQVVDRSQAQLIMEHELFRHIEIEIFVCRSRLGEALRFVRDVLSCCARPGARGSETQQSLERIGMATELAALSGVYFHHYPICVRRVLCDDTLISMAADADDCYCG